MNSHPIMESTTPILTSSDATPLQLGHPNHETQSQTAELHLLDHDQRRTEAKWPDVVVDPSADSQSRPEPQKHHAVGTLSNQPSTIQRAQTQPCHVDGWLELRIWAEMFNDAQQQRIASRNRAERGGVDPIVYEAYTAALEQAEKVCGKHMRACYKRTVPAHIVEWQKNTHGLGDHLMARILGQLGHPRHATPHHWEGTGSKRTLVADEPFERSISQLWQYCGHGRAERKRKGMTADELAAMGSPDLKMLIHLAAECCMKQKASPYRVVYEQTREAAADKLHSVECVRCGPSGKPAQPGTPWSAGHQHAHALRIVGKEILRDLWIIAGNPNNQTTKEPNQ